MSKINRHHAFIPETTLLSAKFKKLSQSSKLLYFYMSNRRSHGKERFTYPYTEIRQDTGMRPETIAKAIREIEKVELIFVTHGGLEQSGNVYEMHDGWLVSR